MINARIRQLYQNQIDEGQYHGKLFRGGEFDDLGGFMETGQKFKRFERVFKKQFPRASKNQIYYAYKQKNKLKSAIPNKQKKQVTKCINSFNLDKQDSKMLKELIMDKIENHIITLGKIPIYKEIKDISIDAYNKLLNNLVIKHAPQTESQKKVASFGRKKFKNDIVKYLREVEGLNYRDAMKKAKIISDKYDYDKNVKKYLEKLDIIDEEKKENPLRNMSLEEIDEYIKDIIPEKKEGGLLSNIDYMDYYDVDDYGGFFVDSKRYIQFRKAYKKLINPDAKAPEIYKAYQKKYKLKKGMERRRRKKAPARRKKVVRRKRAPVKKGSLAQLRREAAKLKISGRSRMNKAGLAIAISDAKKLRAKARKAGLKGYSKMTTARIRKELNRPKYKGGVVIGGVLSGGAPAGGYYDYSSSSEDEYYY